MRAHSVGRFGELWVRLWLRLRGYRIVAHNERHGGVEVDIVASRRTCLHIVEVKSRARLDAWQPHDAVGPNKQARLVRAARALLRRPRWRGSTVSFDVAEVWLWPLPRVRYWADAFRGDDVRGRS
jgi:putative endonuclease